MENEFNIYESFVDSDIIIRQFDNTKISGTLISIDGYLNSFLINGEYQTLDKCVPFKSLFVRGSVIDYLYRK
ncbi:small nuclear ribonucleoprotein-associated protein [Vairimorpha necatrix]|uniref:Small nuclear ribonucleoprotein-associated protein n=1 Tax=Vairimorpha necatrix TaxID=6039 RepID=A0AAX4JG01_9MICR